MFELVTGDQLLDAIEILIEQWEIEALPGRLPYDKWQVLREAALRRDGYMCQGCSKTNVELNVHHIATIGRGGSNHLSNLVTLCFGCHKRIHPWMGMEVERERTFAGVTV